MAKASRDLKVHLELSEEEARQVYLHLRPKYSPNKCSHIKEEIEKALGYKPTEGVY